MEKFINLDEIISDTKNILAHIKEDVKENLNQHTSLCQKYYQDLNDIKGTEEILRKLISDILGYPEEENKEIIDTAVFMARNTVTFHDTGKINPDFQKDKMKNKNIHIKQLEYTDGSTHSMLSARIYSDYFLQKVKDGYKEKSKKDYKKMRFFIFLNAYVISRHHSDLSLLNETLNDIDRYIYESIEELGENILKYDSFVRNNKNTDIAKKFNETSEKLSDSQKISVYIYVKYLYSILVASDYYATTEFMNSKATADIKDNSKILKKMAKEYENSALLKKYIRPYQNKREGKDLKNAKDINILRNEIFLEAEKNLEKNIDKDIFFIEAPTGIGKSNIAMNLSFKLSEKNNLQKIIYVYPFNTLVEQNVQSIENIFGKDSDNNDEILSNITVVNSLTPIGENIMTKNGKKDDYNAYIDYYEKILLDSQFYHYPFILTTHVSFFSKIFSHKREDIFGFYQLSNSVIVLDEVQNYRIGTWTETIMFLSKISEMMGVKFVIMSATLPRFDILLEDKEGFKNQNIVNLVEEPKKYFENPMFKNRVEADFSLLDKKDISFEDLIEHIEKNTKKGQKILIEFISKQNANEFYEKLKEENSDDKIEIITGDDKSPRRRKILEQIKDFKDSQKRFILISTQVIEAGVDIDMDTGYKDISKLDSEEQFLGRINRSNKKQKAKAYFFNMGKTENIYRNDKIRTNKKFVITEKEMQEILKTKDFKTYYEKILPYVIADDKKLSDKGLKDFFEIKMQELDFVEIDDYMKVIDDNRFTMNIFFNIEIELDGEIISGKEVWEKYKELLKDNEMSYAQKKIELSKVRAKMANFIYEFPKDNNISACEYIGDLLYREDGENFFEDGKLIRKKLTKEELIM